MTSIQYNSFQKQTSAEDQNGHCNENEERPVHSRSERAWPSWQAEMSEKEATGTTGLRRYRVMQDDAAGHKRHSNESDSTTHTRSSHHQ